MVKMTYLCHCEYCSVRATARFEALYVVLLFQKSCQRTDFLHNIYQNLPPRIFVSWSHNVNKQQANQINTPTIRYSSSHTLSINKVS